MKRRPKLVLDASLLSARPHAISTEIKGALPVPVLEAALSQLMLRHDALRTSVDMSEKTLRVHQRLPLPEIFHVDLGPASYACGRADAVRGFVECQVEHGFELQGGPLWSCAVARLDAATSCLVLCAHPVIADIASLAQWLKELEGLYRASCATESLDPALLEREASPVAQRFR